MNICLNPLELLKVVTTNGTHMMLIAGGKRYHKCESLILATCHANSRPQNKKHSFGHPPFDISRHPTCDLHPWYNKSVLTGEAAISELIPGVVLVGPRRGRVTRLVPHAPW